MILKLYQSFLIIINLRRLFFGLRAAPDVGGTWAELAHRTEFLACAMIVSTVLLKERRVCGPHVWLPAGVLGNTEMLPKIAN